jgi:RimJ/RimL family protein N-acetyltransferase
VRLFGDEEFMVFSGGALDFEAANRRFDRMLERARELPFAKQPVVERSTGTIIGYSGVDRFEFEGESRLEFGYRLVPEAWGQGYVGFWKEAEVSGDVTELYRLRLD